MPKSTAMGNELLKLVFNNVLMAGIGDAGSDTPSPAVGSFWVSLHTSDPGAAGNQNTNETAYNGYGRVAVVRDASGFTVIDNSVRFTSPVNFGTCQDSPGSALTHFGIGDFRTGSGKLRYSGTLSPSIVMAMGATPRIDAASGLVTED